MMARQANGPNVCNACSKRAFSTNDQWEPGAATRSLVAVCWLRVVAVAVAVAVAVEVVLGCVLVLVVCVAGVCGSCGCKWRCGWWEWGWGWGWGWYGRLVGLVGVVSGRAFSNDGDGDGIPPLQQLGTRAGAQAQGDARKDAVTDG